MPAPSKRKRGSGATAVSGNAGTSAGGALAIEQQRFLHVLDYANSRQRDLQDLIVASGALAQPKRPALDKPQPRQRHLRRRAASHTRYNSLPIKMRLRKQGASKNGSVATQSRRVKRRQWWQRAPMPSQHCDSSAPPGSSGSAQESSACCKLATHVWHAKRFHMFKPPPSWGTFVAAATFLHQLFSAKVTSLLTFFTLRSGPWVSLPQHRSDRGIAAAVSDASRKCVVHDESFLSRVTVSDLDLERFWETTVHPSFVRSVSDLAPCVFHC